MPISPIVLQRRHAELGRIRLGDQQSTSSGKTRPNKLSRFRLTSASERYIRDLAELYGGQPRQWDNQGVLQWEVYTEAASIPVIAVKGGLSQWLETWSGGGCVHRCDGEKQADGTTYCDPDDRAHQDAKPTTRLSVMLPELEAIGVWRMESHGWNAAAEIPAVAELAQYVGDLVPAHLHLVERRAIKDGKTSRFVVPVLDLQIGTARLKEIVAARSGGGSSNAQLAATGDAPAAIEGKRPDYAAHADAALDLDTVRDIWEQAKAAGHLDDALKAHFTKRARAISAAAQATAESPADSAGSAKGEDPVEAEVVPEPAAGGEDAVWQQILAAAGEQGMGLDAVSSDFAESVGVIPDEASLEELKAYLAQVTTGEAVSA